MSKRVERLKAALEWAISESGGGDRYLRKGVDAILNPAPEMETVGVKGRFCAECGQFGILGFAHQLGCTSTEVIELTGAYTRHIPQPVEYELTLSKEEAEALLALVRDYFDPLTTGASASIHNKLRSVLGW